MPDVVVGALLGAAGLYRQRLLGSVQGLDLGLLLHTHTAPPRSPVESAWGPVSGLLPGRCPAARRTRRAALTAPGSPRFAGRGWLGRVQGVAIAFPR
jgi:hypothetical protein